MRARKLLLILVIIFIMPLFSGCWDKVELEEEGYVAAIGLEEGSNNSVKVTFQITNPKAGGSNTPGGSGGTSKRSDTISVDAPGILIARDLVSAAVTRRISLAHSKVLIASESFAKTDKFFHLVEAALRDKEMRRAMTIMVVRESASEFIKNNTPVLEERPQKFYEFMSKRWKDTGFVPPFSNLNRFMQRTEQGESVFLATYGTTKNVVDKAMEVKGNQLHYLPGEIRKEGGNPTEIIGAAVFKQGRMVGKLTGEEVRLVTLLRAKPEVKYMLYSFPDPLAKGKFVAARIIKQKDTKVKVDISGGTPKINVTVPISIEVLGIISFVDYPENLSKQEILKKSIEEYMEDQSLKLVKKTQTEFQGDPFLWELAARGKFLTYDEYHAYNWMKKYKEAEVTIKYEVKLRSFGKQLNPPQMDLKEEEKSEGELPEK